MVRQLAQLLVLQGTITLIVAASIFVWGGAPASTAALMGGATAAASALAYGAGYWISGAGRADKPLRGFLFAEMCRIVIAIVLLWVGITSLPGERAVAFLGAFVAALMAYLFTLLF